MELNIRHRSSVDGATARPQHACGTLRPRSLYKPEGLTSGLHPTRHDRRTPEPYCRRVGTPSSPRAVQTSELPELALFVPCTSERDAPAIHIDANLSKIIDRGTTNPPMQHHTRSRPIAADEQLTPLVRPHRRRRQRVGDDSPSLRRPWSSRATPRGGYYKTQQDAVHIPGSFTVAPVTSLALQPLHYLLINSADVCIWEIPC